MKTVCGVLTLLVYAIHDHRRRFNGKDPLSLWIAKDSMFDLIKEINYQYTDEVVSVTVLNIPVHVSKAEYPYLMNTKMEYEIL